MGQITCFKCRRPVPETDATILDVSLSLRDYISGEQGERRRSSLLLCPTCTKRVSDSLKKLERRVSQDISDF